MRLLATFALISAFAAAVQAADEVPPASTAPVPKGTYEIDKAHTSLLFHPTARATAHPLHCPLKGESANRQAT